MRPEHTVAAYQLAIEQGADVIECDLAVTKVSFLFIYFKRLVSEAIFDQLRLFVVQ